MAVCNAVYSAEMKSITLNKLSAKLKGECLEIPHYVSPRPLSVVLKTDFLKEVDRWARTSLDLDYFPYLHTPISLLLEYLKT